MLRLYMRTSGCVLKLVSAGAIVATLVAAAFAAPASASVKFVTKWGSSGTGNGQFDYPTGIGLDASGHVYVADTGNQRVSKFTSSGGFLSSWGSLGTGDGQFGNTGPTDVATDSSGNVYVADRGNDRIEKFTASGAFISAWGWGVQDGSNQYQVCTSSCRAGVGGFGEGQFKPGPGKIAVDGADDVYVTDGGVNASRIEKFDSSGAFLTQWGTDEAAYGLAATGTGSIYVTTRYFTSGSGDFESVDRYSAAGALQDSWVPEDIGANGVASGPSGNVYVTSFASIFGYSPSGDFLFRWGDHGTGSGQFSSPADLATDSLDNIYVVDSGNYRIQKFHNGFGVKRSGSTLEINAALGTTDDLAISRVSPSTFRVTDLPGGAYAGSGPNPGTGCTRVAAYIANCSASGISRIQVYSNDKADRVTNSTGLPSFLAGGDGKDVLVGGTSKDTLTGGPAADVMKGMNGSDELLAHDLASDTTIDCGLGTDKADLDKLPKDPNSVVKGCESKARH